MTSSPTVSVLMPAYNAAAYLAAAIGSLLGQSFGDFELIVVDDGSIDGTPEILAGFRDPRLTVLRQPENRGYAPALNRALEVARGRYVARQDADDLSLPERLGAQVEAFERRPELTVLGTAYQAIDEGGTAVAAHRPPQSDTAIRWQMLFHNAFAHSSVMFRRAALGELRYDPSLVPAEDYALWSRLLDRGAGANLGEPLVRYRRHPEQISRRQASLQRDNADRVSAANLARVGVRLSAAELRVVRERALATPRPPSAAEIPSLARTVEILEAFARQPGLDPSEVRAVRRRWARQVLSGLPLHCLGAAWRTGLLSAALRAAPGSALSAGASRLRRRRRRASRAGGTVAV